MRIAFTSCMDVLDDSEQKVWHRIAEKEPQVLLLLGDNIYMDFGFWPISNHPLGKPKSWDNAKFAREMYRRYQAQSQVASFRQLLAGVDHVGAIWDDHDFAWNNTVGTGAGEDVVPKHKKLISKALHLQYRTWLRSQPLSSAYPPQPDLDEMMGGEDKGIQESFDLDTVRFVMLDTRYYRAPMAADANSSLLGNEQQQWLQERIESWGGVSLLCSSTTLLQKEGWNKYQDLDWLKQRNLSRSLFLTGDIHDKELLSHPELGGVIEATASGAARPLTRIGGIDNILGGIFHSNTEIYGILDIEADSVSITLYKKNKAGEQRDVQF